MNKVNYVVKLKRKTRYLAIKNPLLINRPDIPAILYISYYALPSQPAIDKFGKLSWQGTGYQLRRWLKANFERGYMGFRTRNQLAEWAFWHYPAEFTFSLQGI